MSGPPCGCRCCQRDTGPPWLAVLLLLALAVDLWWGPAAGLCAAAVAVAAPAWRLARRRKRRAS